MATVTVNDSGLINALAKIENSKATNDVKEPNFEMHYPVSMQVLIAIGSIVFAIFAVLGAAVIDEDEGKIVCGGFLGFLCILCIICLIFYRHWKLKFDDYGLEYTPGFGCSKELRYAEILSVKKKAGSLLLKTEDISIQRPTLRDWNKYFFMSA